MTPEILDPQTEQSSSGIEELSIATAPSMELQSGMCDTAPTASNITGSNTPCDHADSGTLNDAIQSTLQSLSMSSVFETYDAKPVEPLQVLPIPLQARRSAPAEPQAGCFCNTSSRRYID